MEEVWEYVHGLFGLNRDTFLIFPMAVWKQHRWRETTKQARNWRAIRKTKRQMARTVRCVQTEGNQVRWCTETGRIQHWSSKHPTVVHRDRTNCCHPREGDWLDHSHKALPETQGVFNGNFHDLFSVKDDFNSWKASNYYFATAEKHEKGSNTYWWNDNGKLWEDINRVPKTGRFTSNSEHLE